MDVNYFQKLDVTNAKYLLWYLNDNFVSDLKMNFY